MPEFHKPVLLSETIALLDPKPGGVFVDATLGGGGHAEQILEKTAPDGVLIGTDRDPEAVAYARQRLRGFGDRARIYEANYRDIGSIVRAEGRDEVDGVLFDLGISSHELESGRGFSFQGDEPLDMRMNPTEDIVTAWDIVNNFEEAELATLIWEYGEERYSRRIARAIVERRQGGRIQSTGELVDVIQGAVGSRYRGQRIHPATRTFQALRIVVNDELGAVDAGLAAAVGVLRDGARVCVISFHSLEDRIAKNTFRRLAGKCECPPERPECTCGSSELVRIITKRPVVPGPDETRENPRSRSAKLRCAEKI
jgi:16S rRNA (cytosine1402-N4)-methyltransferase